MTVVLLALRRKLFDIVWDSLPNKDLPCQSRQIGELPITRLRSIAFLAQKTKTAKSETLVIVEVLEKYRVVELDPFGDAERLENRLKFVDGMR
jgi:hypothetical protein